MKKSKLVVIIAVIAIVCVAAALVVLKTDLLTDLLNNIADKVASSKPVVSIPVEEIRNAKSIGSFSDEGIAYIRLANEKYGYIDAKGNTISDAIWEDAYTFKDGFGIVENEDGLYGVIDTNGNIVVELKYNGISWYHEDGFFKAYTENNDIENHYLLDKTGKVTHDLGTSVNWIAKGHYGFTKDGLKGVKDLSGNVTIEPTTKYLNWGGEHLWTVTADNKLCEIDMNGNVLKDVSTVLSMVNNLAAVNDSNVTAEPNFNYFGGIRDLTGNLTSFDVIVNVEVVEDLVSSMLFTEGLFNGTTVYLPCLSSGYVINYTYLVNDNYITTEVHPLKSTYGLLDIDYDKSYNVLLDTNGNMLCKPGEYDSFSGIGAPDMLKVKKGNKYGLLSSNLKTTYAQTVYDSIGNLCDGLMYFKRDGYYGYMNAQGNIAIPAKYTKANSFGGGYAAVQDSDGWHIIDNTGYVVF